MNKNKMKLANCKPRGGQNLYETRVNCILYNSKQENYCRLNLFFESLQKKLFILDKIIKNSA